jgi:glycosyltransferase involved in cell wall biosynthesis
MISVLILTKNEAVNIEACVRSCSWSDDVIVFDSHSSDGTAEKAEELGARVFQRQFDNFGSQREAARLVDYKNPWVLAIDADERPDNELIDELKKIANADVWPRNAYRLRRKDHFMGKWIKNSTLYPSWFIRFYRPQKIYYEPRAVHEYPNVEGPIGELHGHLIHYSFNKGLEEWFVKHCRYAAFEAEENLKVLNSPDHVVYWKGLVSTDPVVRRKALKELSMRLPFRPTLRFLYSFVVRRGFLDGIAGYRYAKMLSLYEQMIVLNIQDKKASVRNLS